MSNTFLGHIQDLENQDIVQVISNTRKASGLKKEAFEQQLTKAIIEAMIVERLKVDNYSIVHQFLPNPHAFYEQGWQSRSEILIRCGRLLAHMKNKELGFYYLAAGIPREANMLPQVQGYLQMVMR
ncbi:MAG: hypothetical protein AB8H12_24355 [Lewinella sp.]